MNIYIDKDTNTLISEPTFKSTVDTLTFKRGDAASFNVVFVTGNTSLSATMGKKIIFGVKQDGAYDGTFVTSASAYTTSGVNYIMSPSFNTVTLNALLSSGDGNPNNDIGSVTLMGEFTWSEDNGATWYSTNTFNVVVQNDVIKGIEGTPLEVASPEDWLDTQLDAQLPAKIDVLRPPYLESTATPASYWPLEVLYYGTYTDALISTGDPLIFSTDGNTTNPLAASDWAVMYHDGTYWQYQHDDATHTPVLNDYSEMCANTVSPQYAGVWAASGVVTDAVLNDFTPGIKGQMLIVDSLDITTDTHAAWICVRQTPVLWQQMS